VFITALNRREHHTVSPWWLSGGISAENVLSAFQAKGAASYAASKSNLANPGTNDLLDGTAYPTWNSTDGWVFARTSSQYLDNQLAQAADTDFAVLVRISGVVDQVYATNMVVGGRNYANSNGLYYIQPRSSYLVSGIGSAGYLEWYPSTSGVLAVKHSGSVATCWVDGVKESETTSTMGARTTPGAIGAMNSEGTLLAFYTGNVQAVAYYKALTNDQLVAVSTAMAAL
jgi:hypothetical protein